MSDLEVMSVSALKDNYIWVVTNLKEKIGLVIDPSEAEPVMTFIEQHKIKPMAILITHHHWDHTNGINGLLGKYDLPVYGSNSQVQGVNRVVKDQDRLNIDDRFGPIQVISIPGHTLDHTAYYFAGSLFCGDTLFSAGCGRLFEGTAEQLFTSLQKLTQLPPQTKVYCAHEYTEANLRFAKLVDPTNTAIDKRIQQVKHLRAKLQPTLPSTLAEEMTTNPFLRCHAPEIKNQVEQYSSKTLSTPLEVFTELRKWKDKV